MTEPCSRQFITMAAALLIPLFAVPSDAFAQQTQPIESADKEEIDEEIIVQATRSKRRVQDEPVRVEVISREEIEEKILMRPGNVAMVLSETGGLRVKVTFPAFGSLNIRV